MFELLDVPPEVVDRPGAPPLAVVDGTIRFEDVHFSYDPDREILKGISFEVPAERDGRHRRPVGRRQVDDLAAALPLLRRDRRAHPDRRPGHPRRDARRALRAAIGIVPQDTVLFNDTIGYNIRYGRWDASDDGGARARRTWRRSATSSRACRTATTRRSASAG